MTCASPGASQRQIPHVYKDFNAIKKDRPAVFSSLFLFVRLQVLSEFILCVLSPDQSRHARLWMACFEFSLSGLCACQHLSLVRCEEAV